MLATLVDVPFHREGWTFEEKYDGYRVIACKRGSQVGLWSRNGNDKTQQFAEIAEAVARLPARNAVLDGEVVGFDERLISRFQLLQRGGTPLVYAVFDCLGLEGRDLRKRPLAERRAALEALIGNNDRLFPSRQLARNGLAAYRTAVKRGYEGVVGKDLASVYTSGRSKAWLKVKVRREEEFVIGGYTLPSGARTGFGALLLGAYQGRKLRYVGKVGAGFSSEQLQKLPKLFGETRRDKPAFDPPPREKGATWLEPRYVGQIAFQEWTADGKLRQPVFLGLRDDKSPEEVRFPRLPRPGV
jgi:bifunctional non-homologous end joining protein LigD